MIDTQIARPILVATLLAGTLDLVAAFLQAAITRGAGPDAILHSIASGIYGATANEGGIPMALLGLLLHFSIMALMVAAFVFAARRLPMLAAQPLIWGPLYGIALWCVMYLIVLPMTFQGFSAFNNPANIAIQLTFHILLVGTVIALVAARFARR